MNSSQQTEKSTSVRRHRGRRRKRHLYEAVVRQIEFYLSDAHLRHSGHMLKRLSDHDGWIDIDTLVGFPVLASMLSDGLGRVRAEDVWKAVIMTKEERLKRRVTGENQRQVGRVHPLSIVHRPDRQEIHERTIYVEKLSAAVNRDMMRHYFARWDTPFDGPTFTLSSFGRSCFRFGSVTYVSLPTLRPNGPHRGFAFIEFENASSVDRACQATLTDQTRLPQNTVSHQVGPAQNSVSFPCHGPWTDRRGRSRYLNKNSRKPALKKGPAWVGTSPVILFITWSKTPRSKRATNCYSSCCNVMLLSPWPSDESFC